MPSERYNIDIIERYLNQGMPGAERAEFEALLVEDEGYRREVAAYRSLLDGFHSLRGESFRQRLVEWEKQSATAGADEAEYIEWFLKGELTGEAHAIAAQKAREDVGFAREVEAYRRLHEGFDAARNDAFRQKMKSWEQEKAQRPAPSLAARRKLWPRLAAAAAILLLVGFGFNWYVQSAFSNRALIEANYQPFLGGSTMGGEQMEQEAISRRYAEAHRLFKQQEYGAAYQAFDELLAQLPAADLDGLSRTYFQQQAEWNRLLAALAMTPPPMDVEREARRIATTEGHAFRQQAEKLLRKLQSPLYRWAN